MNLAEYIKQLENDRARTLEALNTIADQAAANERTFEPEEQKEFDGLTSEIAEIDGNLVRFKKLLDLQAANALPVLDEVRKQSTPRAPVRSSGPFIQTQRQPEEKFPGQFMTRMVMAKTIAKITGRDPAAVAKHRWGNTHPTLVDVIKADVAGLGSSSGEAGAELVHYDRYLGDFINYLYARTVYTKLGLREVPANINIAGQDVASTGYWVGESKAIPVTKPEFMDVNLTPLKVGAIAVISKELIQDSSPSVEMLVRDDLVMALTQKIDSTFCGTAAAVAGISPAGILNGVTINESAGTDDAAVINDMKELLKPFHDANNDEGLTWLMHPSLATSIGMLRNALDQFTFPGINAGGGILNNLSVVTGHNVNRNHLILLKPSDIWRIGMGGMEVDISLEGTVEMNNAPAMDTDTPTAPTGKFVNLWQTNSVGIKCLQRINYQKRRSTAVRYIGDADYGGSVST